jgi:hypothetical protein
MRSLLIANVRLIARKIVTTVMCLQSVTIRIVQVPTARVLTVQAQIAQVD